MELTFFSYSENEERTHTESELYECSAFDGPFSRIAVIGVLIFSDDMFPQGTIAWYGNNEPDMLRQF